ncbi:hypothetical protein [Paenibacillus koleovorans]|nr:hypothetical protein [Paenibacillus koleovorans]
MACNHPSICGVCTYYSMCDNDPINGVAYYWYFDNCLGDWVCDCPCTY